MDQKKYVRFIKQRPDRKGGIIALYKAEIAEKQKNLEKN